MARIKYIRVSTQHQSTARQEQNRNEFERVFIDKASGKNTERPEFQKMMEYIREGDVVVFESFSRISRSLSDLLKILDAFKAKGVKFYSEKENVGTDCKDSTTAELIINMLGAISQYEREINKERREYGFNKALQEGRVGRPKAVISPEYQAVYADWKAHVINGKEAIKRSGMSRTTFYKLAQQMERQEQQAK